MSYLDELKGRIVQFVKPVIEDEGYKLIEINIMPRGDELLLRFIVNKPGGITMDECARVNRKLGGLLDNADIIRQSYVLEVFSPGIDRPLKHADEFRCVLGRDLVVKMNDGRIIKGSLVNVRESKIMINCKNEKIEVDIKDIDSAKQRINLSKEQK